MTTPKQQAYLRQNTVKDATVKSWVVFRFTHVDWNEDLNFVAIEDYRSVEFVLSLYTFKGIQYTPVTASIRFPRESDTSTGKATITLARAATGLKRLMRQITPANATNAITCAVEQYQEGLTEPVRSFSGFVAKDYPKISGQDIQIQAARFNPSLLTSDFIVTTELYPELRQA